MCLRKSEEASVAEQSGKKSKVIRNEVRVNKAYRFS